MNFPVLNFKCPQCGRRNVHPFSKATGSWGSSTNIGNSGLRVGGSTITHQRMWVCSDCGHEFRDVNDWYQNLEPRYKRGTMLFDILTGGICGFFGLIWLLISPTIGVFWLALTVGFILLFHKIANSMKQKELEKIEALAERCSAD